MSKTICQLVQSHLISCPTCSDEITKMVLALKKEKKVKPSRKK